MATKNDLEVEADRRAAEDSGCAVNVKPYQQQASDHETSCEVSKSVEEGGMQRGRGNSWNRPRSRGFRSRPQGHFGQGSYRNNCSTESDLHPERVSDKKVSPSHSANDLTSDKHSPYVTSPSDWDAGQLESSVSQLPHGSNSQYAPYSGQKTKESSWGHRSAQGRGHARGPFAKYVTVPDASHSRDVRHVEQVNNSIVINIDRSARPETDSTRRGRGGGGTANMRNNSSSEDSGGVNIRDKDVGRLPSEAQQSYRGSYRGRRPFRGRGGDSSFQGQGRGGEGFRRGRGDGPRPFRGGYRGGDRGRVGGRISRRAVIVTSKEPVDSSQVPEDDWDKDASGGATATTVAAESNVGDVSWPNSDEPNANLENEAVVNNEEGSHGEDAYEDLEDSQSLEQSTETGSEQGKDSDNQKDSVNQNQPVENKPDGVPIEALSTEANPVSSKSDELSTKSLISKAGNNPEDVAVENDKKLPPEVTVKSESEVVVPTSTVAPVSMEKPLKNFVSNDSVNSMPKTESAASNLKTINAAELTSNSTGVITDTAIESELGKLSSEAPVEQPSKSIVANVNQSEQPNILHVSSVKELNHSEEIDCVTVKSANASLEIPSPLTENT